MGVRHPPMGIKKYFGEKLKGFSLPEIVVAMGIIIALGSGAFAVSDHMLKAGRFNAAKSHVSALSVAVLQYRFEVGSLPASLSVLTNKVDGKGPWIANDGLKDPWNRDYHYRVATDNSYFVIWSDGHNRVNDSDLSLPQFNNDDIGIMSR